MTLNYLLEQFYIAEFVSNQAMADYYIKLIYVEPDPHDTGNLSPEMSDARQYYSDWLSLLDPVKAQKMSIEQLRKDLATYVTKQPKATKTIGFNNNNPLNPIKQNGKEVNQGA